MPLPLASWFESMTYKVSTGKFLTPVDKLKDLGLVVSSDLLWRPHVRSIVQRARSVAAWVLSLQCFNARYVTIMMTLCKSLVRCHLEYCLPLIS